MMVDMSRGERGRLALRLLAVILAAITIAAAALPVAAQLQQPNDAYLWFRSNDLASESIVVMVGGVPEVRYDGLPKPQENPVTVAQWDSSSTRRATASSPCGQLTRLLSHQRPDGTWAYHFDYPMEWAGTEMRAPWVSALAQGQALSLFVRTYRLTGNQKYLNAGRRAMRAFAVPVNQGGVLRIWHGHKFYEEYTTKRPALVLNGFLFSLIGLREFADETQDADAWRLWREGEETAASLVRRYDMGGGASSYGLAHLAGGPNPTPVGGAFYPQIHVDLTREMYNLTGRQVYREMSKKWSAVLPARPWLPFTVSLLVELWVLFGLLVLVRRLGWFSVLSNWWSGADALDWQTRVTSVDHAVRDDDGARGVDHDQATVSGRLAGR